MDHPSILARHLIVVSLYTSLLAKCQVESPSHGAVALLSADSFGDAAQGRYRAPLCDVGISPPGVTCGHLRLNSTCMPTMCMRMFLDVHVHETLQEA